MQLLDAPQGSFQLDRRPPAGNSPLRAWDAADEYVLHHLAERARPVDPRRTLVVNDSFGALTVALRAQGGGPPTMFTDSHVSVLAARENLTRAGFDPTLRVLAGPGALAGSADAPSPLDLVIVKVPKSLGLLEDQLHRLRGVVSDTTEVLAAAMARHLHRSTIELFEGILGPTRTSLARKKARLAHCAPDLDLDPGPSPWPKEYTLPDGSVVLNHAGVHAAGRLDPGTRFFIEHLPGGSVEGTILDLGCGDGAVGVTAAAMHPRAALLFVDESHLAVASAEATFRRNHGTVRDARFLVGDVLDDLEDGSSVPSGSVDLVLANPPFHADHAIGDTTAWRMFVQARRVLREGGELRVVGNRHLAHHARLSRVFGNSQLVAGGPKFVVSRATKQA